MHGSEDPCNGNGPGVSQGVPEGEFSSFPSSLLSPEMNICLQPSRAIWPGRSGMGCISSRYKGTPPWKNPSSVTCPSPIAPDAQAEREKKILKEWRRDSTATL